MKSKNNLTVKISAKSDQRFQRYSDFPFEYLDEAPGESLGEGLLRDFLSPAEDGAALHGAPPLPLHHSQVKLYQGNLQVEEPEVILSIPT